MNLGKVKEITTEFVKSIIWGNSDVRTAPQSLPFGIDSKPVNGDISIYMQTENRNKSVHLGYIRPSNLTNSGETRIYATDDEGVNVFSILLKNNGTVEFGGNDDNFVRYSELKNEYDKTKDVVDTISNTLKTWTPVSSDGGAALKAAYTAAIGVKTTGDISTCKIDEIKTFK